MAYFYPPKYSLSFPGDHSGWAGYSLSLSDDKTGGVVGGLHPNLANAPYTWLGSPLVIPYLQIAYYQSAGTQVPVAACLTPCLLLSLTFTVFGLQNSLGTVLLATVGLVLCSTSSYLGFDPLWPCVS